MNALVVVLVLLAGEGSRVPNLKPMPVKQAVTEWVAQKGGAEPYFQWQLTSVVGEIETPGVIWADGLPVKMRAVRVKGTPEGVRDELLARFLAAGLYVPETQPQPVDQLQVTAVDPRFLVSYTAIISGLAPVVTVVLTETNVGLGLHRSEPEPVLPVLPGSSEVLTTRGESFERIVYETDSTPAQVASFYGDVLGKAGFRAAGEGTWQGKDARFTLITQQNGKRLAVALQKSLTNEQFPEPSVERESEANRGTARPKVARELGDQNTEEE